MALSEPLSLYTLLTKYNNVASEYANLLSQYNELSTQLGNTSSNYETLLAQYNELNGLLNTANSNYESLVSQYNQLSDQLSTTSSNYNTLLSQYQTLLNNYESLSDQYNDLSDQINDVSTSVGTINETDEAILQYNYEGKDLTEAFADEINDGFSGDAWAWIKDRVDNANYTGLRIADYIPITMNGYSMNAQIMGIDTYYGYYAADTTHHIDWITKEVYPENILWNTTATNNGTSSQGYPWLASNLYSVMNNTWLGYLPSELQAVISEKYVYLEQRYSSSGSLTEPSGCGYTSMGKLWVPLAPEIFGGTAYTCAYHSEHVVIQYPLFVGTWKHTFKQAAGGTSYRHWWTSSPYVGLSTYVCSVNWNNGLAHSSATNSTVYAPACFRIA